MKKSLRAFGIGIFLVGAIFSFSGKNATSLHSSNEESKMKKEIASLEKQLANANNEINQLKAAKNNEDSVTTEEEQANENKANSETQTNSNDIVTGTIFIYERMSIYDIGKQVEDIGVLNNGRELELFLSKPEYSRSIQKGQFELDSSMTIEQMARTITGKTVQ